uniref:integrin alpha-8 n=1 Tax=Ciona intestinalis TaxID=7719 RepID=UPI00089DAB68|nr:integrin alpha-8 [Ciona intestinalis]|eukprot:XP_018672667.1 integrin alpha-8 [Ciona intestinalis]
MIYSKFAVGGSFVWYSFFLCMLRCALSFNLDAEFPTFFSGPAHNSYFGFAVDYYSEASQTWVVVGAPRNGFNGEVFKCTNTPGAEQCNAIRVSKEVSQTGVQNMFGSTVVLGQNKELLMCAPQFAQKSVVTRSSGKSIYYDLVGICYFTTDFSADNLVTYRYSPCSSDLGSHYADLHSYCQAGFSAAFTKDNRKLVLGAIGSYYNQGSIMLVKDLLQNISSLPYHTAEFKPDVPSGWGEVDYYRHTYDSNYMGYSVATGITGSNLPLLVTSAPRRLGYNLLGSVIVYDETMQAPLANFTGEQIGEYFGEGLEVVDLNNDGLDDIIIGSPLYSDVKQKVPEIGRIYVYYQETGAASSSTERRLEFSPPTIINGNSSMARFGRTIVSIGDVNGDGYNDILVSAPYERNGTEDSEEKYGALYLFNGGVGGVRSYPSQVIHGLKLENTPNFTPGDKIRGLGYGMKGGKDTDGNGYPDVVVGAYLSDKVVVIKARPVVKLLVIQTITPNKIDLETLSCDLNPTTKSACFYVETCFSYSGKTLPDTVNMSYSYDVDSGKEEREKRSYLLDDSPRNLTLRAGDQQQCVHETVFMKKDVRDKQTEIAVTVNYWLQENHLPTEPVLDVLAGTSSTTRADIFKDCGPDEICIPDLVVNAKLSPDTVQVGKYSEINVKASVWNNGENAYLTTMVVNYPQYVTFIGLQEDKVDGRVISCVDLNPFLLCEVANPLKVDTRIDLVIQFGVNELQGDVDVLPLLLYANCTNEQNNQSPLFHTMIHVEVVANVKFYNVSTPSLIRLDKESENAALNQSASKPLTHTYEITNAGPAVISKAEISLLWPLSVNGDSKDLLLPLLEVQHSGPVICHYSHIADASVALANDVMVPSDVLTVDAVNHDKSYINCHTDPQNCYEMTCDILEMQPKTDILIELKTELQLAPVLRTSMDTVITSSMQFRITEFPYLINPGPGPTTLSEVNTYAEYPQVPESSTIEWWIIAIAVAAGVLFLLLIILLLWKCGFFKRMTHPQSEEDKAQQQKLTESPDPMQEELEEHLK